MFREWREVTRSIIRGTAGTWKPRYELTRKYIAWTTELFQKSPILFSSFNEGKGIINIRNMFLRAFNFQVFGVDIVSAVKCRWVLKPSLIFLLYLTRSLLHFHTLHHNHRHHLHIFRVVSLLKNSDLVNLPSRLRRSCWKVHHLKQRRTREENLKVLVVVIVC